MRRAPNSAAAQSQAALVARQLDQDIAAAAERRLELKLLDEQAAGLADRRKALEAPAAADGLRMLDQAAATARRARSRSAASGCPATSCTLGSRRSCDSRGGRRALADDDRAELVRTLKALADATERLAGGSRVEPGEAR
jgi:hypothetical protein